MEYLQEGSQFHHKELTFHSDRVPPSRFDFGKSCTILTVPTLCITLGVAATPLVLFTLSAPGTPREKRYSRHDSLRAAKPRII